MMFARTRRLAVMTGNRGDSTEIAQEIIDLIGGDTGLSRLRAARIEALTDGVVFNLMNDGTTEGIVIIRKMGRDDYRVYVAQLGRWVEVRSTDGVTAGQVKPHLWRLIGKNEPVF